MTDRAIKSGRYPGGKNAEGTWQWIAALMPPHSGFAEPFAGSAALARRKMPALQTVLLDRDAAVCRWLIGQSMPATRVLRGCGIRWLERVALKLSEDWLIYLDPPYPFGVRVKKRLYRYELTDADHRRILGAVTSLACRVMISSYSNPLYERRLAAWSRHERPVITRGRSWRTEVLWCNFDARPGAIARPGVPIVGRDYRERERVKRLVARWRQNYARRPEAERRAILTGLLAEEHAGRP